MKKSTTAISYVRTNVISANGDGSNLSKQIQAINEYAYKNGIKIVNTYCDIGVPGTRMGPSLKQMLKDVKINLQAPSIVLCTNIAKFGRRLEIVQKVTVTLTSKNIAVESLDNEMGLPLEVVIKREFNPML
jgi:DNA invertase Pin-like site-specific DNA recombinase